MYLVRQKKYRNFRLIFESKLVTSEMHSGIALWGQTVEKSGDPYSYMGHLVMYPSAYGYFDLYRRNSIYQDKEGVAKKAGKQHDWNRMEILAIGNRIRHVINGKLVADWSDPKPELCQAGPIGLQLHSNKVPQEVQFRGLILTTDPEDKLVTVAAETQSGPVKFLRYRNDDAIAYSILEGDRVRQISGPPYGEWKKTETTHALRDVTLLAPTTPSKVIALAGNYKDHLGDKPTPAPPEPFFKLTSSLQRHEGPIVQPAGAEPVHYEGEVVIVIGKQARKVSEEQALDYVLGITCGNDISARYWQKHDVQWWRAKGSDTFGPVGPYIAAGIDYGNLNLELRVNGEVKQKSNTRSMIHNVAQTVSFISRHVTLEPGDLIFTGTPGKTEGLKPGDVVEVEIESVGVLRNQVVMEDGRLLRIAECGLGS